jgi:hypothetical protein
MKKLSVTCIALVLSACGGGGSGAGTPTPTPLPTPAAEAFYLRVLNVVGLAPEDDEAIDVSAVVASEPETTEPPPI